MPRMKKYIKVVIPDGVDVQEFEKAVRGFAGRMYGNTPNEPPLQQVTEQAPWDAFKGFANDKGTISMTADRSFADDVKAGRVPDSVVEDARRAGKFVTAEGAEPAGSEEIQTMNPKYARCIHRIR